jgi:hypothetical protein
MVIALGKVEAPSGKLLIVDPGYLGIWCHDRRPTMPEGALSSPEFTARANDSVDLAMVGRDAERVGRLLDRQWNPFYVFDIPREGVPELVKRVDEVARTHQLDARCVVLPERVSHRRRIDLAIEHGGGGGEIQFHGIWSAVVGSVPAGAHEVTAEPMPEDGPDKGRLRRIVLVCGAGPIARTEPCGMSAVDYGCLMAVDVDALGLWKYGESLDGLADFVFWGRDAKEAAQRSSAPALGDREFGWRDLVVAEARARGARVKKLHDDEGLAFAMAYRPHSHDEMLMSQIRATQTSSGVVALGGASICGFATSWGDGLFDVYRDLDGDGRLVQIRLELGTEERQSLMRKLELRWWKSALVSRKVLDEGLPVRFLYREKPDRDEDSGWRMFSGYEGDAYSDDPNNIAVVRLSEFGTLDKRVDALLDAPVGSVFERKPEEEAFAPVTDWTPGEDAEERP